MTRPSRLIKMQSYTRTPGVSISQQSKFETDAHDADVAAAAPRRSGAAMLARAAPVAGETGHSAARVGVLGYSRSDTMSGRLTVTSRSLTRPSESE